MENWKLVIEKVEKWQHTKRVPGTSIQEDENIFIKELNDLFTLVKRVDVDRIIFKEGARPPEGIIS